MKPFAEVLDNSFWIFKEGFEVFYYWYFFFPLLLGAAIGAYQIQQKKLSWRKIIYPILAIFFAPILISFLGGIFFNTDSRIVSGITDMITLAHLAYGIIGTIYLKGYRLFFVSVYLIFLFTTAYIWLNAGMSIYNDWL